MVSVEQDPPGQQAGAGFKAGPSWAVPGSYAGSVNGSGGWLESTLDEAQLCPADGGALQDELQCDVEDELHLDIGHVAVQSDQSNLQVCNFPIRTPHAYHRKLHVVCALRRVELALEASKRQQEQAAAQGRAQSPGPDDVAGKRASLVKPLPHITPQGLEGLQYPPVMLNTSSRKVTQAWLLRHRILHSKLDFNLRLLCALQHKEDVYESSAAARQRLRQVAQDLQLLAAALQLPAAPHAVSLQSIPASDSVEGQEAQHLQIHAPLVSKYGTAWTAVQQEAGGGAVGTARSRLMESLTRKPTNAAELLGRTKTDGNTSLPRLSSDAVCLPRTTTTAAQVLARTRSSNSAYLFRQSSANLSHLAAQHSSSGTGGPLASGRTSSTPGCEGRTDQQMERSSNPKAGALSSSIPAVQEALEDFEVSTELLVQELQSATEAADQWLTREVSTLSTAEMAQLHEDRERQHTAESACRQRLGALLTEGHQLKGAVEEDFAEVDQELAQLAESRKDAQIHVLELSMQVAALLSDVRALRMHSAEAERKLLDSTDSVKTRKAIKGQEVSSVKALLDLHATRLSTLTNSDKAADRAFKQVAPLLQRSCTDEEWAALTKAFRWAMPAFGTSFRASFRQSLRPSQKGTSPLMGGMGPGRTSQIGHRVSQMGQGLQEGPAARPAGSSGSRVSQAGMRGSVLGHRPSNMGQGTLPNPRASQAGARASQFGHRATNLGSMPELDSFKDEPVPSRQVGALDWEPYDVAPAVPVDLAQWTPRRATGASFKDIVRGVRMDDVHALKPSTVDETAWKLLVQRVSAQRQLQQAQQHHQQLQCLLERLQSEDATLSNSISQAVEAVQHFKSTKWTLTQDVTVPATLNWSQVLVPLDEHETDMDTWLLLAASQITEANSVIRESARQRVRLVERQIGVKAAIRAVEDEMRLLDGDAAEIAEVTRNMQLLRVTKQLQSLISKGAEVYQQERLVACDEMKKLLDYYKQLHLVQRRDSERSIGKVHHTTACKNADSQAVESFLLATHKQVQELKAIMNIPVDEEGEGAASAGDKENSNQGWPTVAGAAPGGGLQAAQPQYRDAEADRRFAALAEEKQLHLLSKTQAKHIRLLHEELERLHQHTYPFYRA